MVKVERQRKVEIPERILARPSKAVGAAASILSTQKSELTHASRDKEAKKQKTWPKWRKGGKNGSSDKRSATGKEAQLSARIQEVVS